MNTYEECKRYLDDYIIGSDKRTKRHKAELRRLCEFIRTGEIVAANVMASQIYEREEWGDE